jgi:NitT/TauT family transport system permease protein
MFALLIELGLIGATLDLIVNRIARRIVHWQQA